MPSPKPADLAPHLVATKGTVERPKAAAPANEPLTFKVTADVKRRFRRWALDHDMRLNQAFVQALEALEAQERQ